MFWCSEVWRNCTLPLSSMTTVCNNGTQPQTQIKMSRYPFQDVYNHVCWICHPIKCEQHYPRRLPRACWNTLTFIASRQTVPTQSQKWSTSAGHKHSPRPQWKTLILVFTAAQKSSAAQSEKPPTQSNEFKHRLNFMTIVQQPWCGDPRNGQLFFPNFFP